VAAPSTSCVMITRGRPVWAAQSIRYFDAQDEPAGDRELVIVYEDADDLPSLPVRPDVRLVRVARGCSIGDKRNAGARSARGSYVVHWDDDDYQGPDRLRRQLAPLVDGAVDVTGLQGALFFEPASWRFWRTAPAIHARMFLEDVHGGTLAYRHALWDELANYPSTNLREDADFLVAAMQKRARLARVPVGASYRYLRHGHNTWQLHPGQFLDPRGWRAVAEPHADLRSAAVRAARRAPLPCPAWAPRRVDHRRRLRAPGGRPRADLRTHPLPAPAGTPFDRLQTQPGLRAHGCTLCYTPALWRRNPFPDLSHGEDLRFQWSPVAKTIIAHDQSGETSPGCTTATRARVRGRAGAGGTAPSS